MSTREVPITLIQPSPEATRLAAYARQRMSAPEHEWLLALYFDAQGYRLAHEPTLRVYCGDRCHLGAGTYAEVMLDAARRHGAKKIVAVRHHNHDWLDGVPKTRIHLVRDLFTACAQAGIPLRDYVILDGTGLIYSFRDQGEQSSGSGSGSSRRISVPS